MLARARPWLLGMAVLVAFAVAVFLLLATVNLMSDFGEMAKNAPPD